MGKGPDPVVPPPPKIPLIIKAVVGGRPLDGAEVVVKGKGKPQTSGANGLTGANGLANFGPVDPRTKFQITVRKSQFGPPGSPFKPGDNVVDRRARANGTIDVPLTSNVAMLRIVVRDPTETAIAGAVVGIDGAAPMPPTDSAGRSTLVAVPPGVNIRFHAQKAGFGPQPVGNAAFKRDSEVVGFRTLVLDEIATEILHLTRFVGKLTVNVTTPSPKIGAAPDVPLDDAEVQVDGVTSFAKTKGGGKVTFDVPAGQDLHVRARKEGFGNVTVAEIVNLSNAEADVKPGLKDGESKELTLKLAEAPVVEPLITPGTPGDPITVVVKKPHTKPKRVKVNLKSNTSFGGSGVLRMENPSGNVKVFRSATGTDELVFDAKKEILLTTVAVTSGADVFIEGATPTGKVGDLKLTLELRGGTKSIKPPVSIKVTCVELTLDICKGRKSAAVDPEVFSQVDKVNIGRDLHLQDAAKTRHRAKLIVRAVKPSDFTGTLTLVPIATGTSASLALFDKDQETAAPAHVAKPNPHEFPAAKTDTVFFVEGTTRPSGAEHDTGYTLGIKDVGETDADHVAATVIQVEKLQASLDSTKNAASGAQPAAGTFDTTNADLAFAAAAADLMVVVRDAGSITVTAQNVKPATKAANLRWQIERDKADTVGADLPALDKNTGAQVKITPSTAGTFRLICYRDTNETNVHEQGEEFRVLRMVIVKITPQAGVTFTATPSFVGAVNSVSTTNAMRVQADFLLEGGGANRRFGVDQVVLGNVGNCINDNFIVNYPGRPAPADTRNGTASEDPDFKTNPAPGFASPMVDSFNVAVGTEPTGGTTPNRSNSVQTTLGDGPGGNGQLRQVKSLDRPGFGWNGNHPTTGNPWSTTQGANFFREWMLAHTTKFPRNYMALGTGDWTATVIGTRGAGGLWVDSASTLTATAWTISSPPTTADAARAQVLGRSFVKEFGMIISP